ncbi:MAG: NosD domain-containing protein [Candidatus Thorarchaeota archaeon]
MGASNQSSSSAIVVVVVVAIAASLILASTSLTSLFPGTTTTTTTMTTGNQTIPIFPPIENLTEHAPIYIESNQEFAAQADLEEWPGNGTPEAPYIIQGYSFDGTEMCIHIAYTDVYFIIRYCAFTATSSAFWGLGVNIWEADNGLVDHCHFVDLDWGVNLFMTDNCLVLDSYISSTEFGVNVSYSTNSAVIGNIIQNGSVGMLIDQTTNFNVSDNIIMYNEYSMDIWYSRGGHVSHNNITDNVHGLGISGPSNEIMVLYNTMFRNDEIGIALGQSTQSIEVIGNLIGWNVVGNAQDDGTSNTWDDGISTGNGWSDYSGSGVYTVPGTAESIDHFPVLIEF